MSLAAAELVLVGADVAAAVGARMLGILAGVHAVRHAHTGPAAARERKRERRLVNCSANDS